MQRKSTHAHLVETADGMLSDNSLTHVRGFVESRKLQTIVIKEPDEDEDSSPTRSPVSMTRPTRIVICTSVSEDVFALTQLTTEVEYSYAVQLDQTTNEVSSYDWEIDIPKWVSGATVDALADSLCGGEDEVVPDDPLTRRRDLANDCILSVSSGPRDVRMDYETCSTPGASCARALYSGSVKVTHTIDCSQFIEEVVMDVLKSLFDSDEFFAAINENAGKEGINVVGVNFTEAIRDPTPEPSTPEPTPAPQDASIVASVFQAEPEDNNGITSGGKTMIAASALLVASMFTLLLVWRRKHSRRRRKLHDDLRSIKTDWSTDTADKDYMKPDFYDLALSHSKLDVHHCNSGMCRVCRPNLGLVNMLPVPRGSGPSMSPIQDILSSETGRTQSPNSDALSPDAADRDLNPGLFNFENSRLQSCDLSPQSYDLEDDMASTSPSHELENSMAATEPSYNMGDNLCPTGSPFAEPNCGLDETMASMDPACGLDPIGTTTKETVSGDEDVTFVRVEAKSSRLNDWQKFKRSKRALPAASVVL
jgi:hypothetical protein